MTTLREAAQQALEALKSVQDHRPNDETNAAVTALRAALKQQDEPKGGGHLPPPLQVEPVQDQDDILRMAQEAGIIWWSSDQTFLLTRFAALAAAAEREACAKVCVPYVNSTNDGIALVALNIHDAIRARGEK